MSALGSQESCPVIIGMQGVAVIIHTLTLKEND